MPSVCTAHQAEPEEAEAEVPQVSPHLPYHILLPSAQSRPPWQCIGATCHTQMGGT